MVDHARDLARKCGIAFGAEQREPDAAKPDVAEIDPGADGPQGASCRKRHEPCNPNLHPRLRAGPGLRSLYRNSSIAAFFPCEWLKTKLPATSTVAPFAIDWRPVSALPPPSISMSSLGLSRSRRVRAALIRSRLPSMNV